VDLPHPDGEADEQREGRADQQRGRQADRRAPGEADQEAVEHGRRAADDEHGQAGVQTAERLAFEPGRLELLDVQRGAALVPHPRGDEGQRRELGGRVVRRPPTLAGDSSTTARA
jgi:hypothetical protein